MSNRIVSIPSQWKTLLDRSWIEGLDNTPFLAACRDGTATREELRTYVRQQFHYSRHFTRYLCALLANVANEGDRRELVENLFEEMGLGEFGSVPHSQIYRNMMKAMRLDPDEEPVFEATQNLIDTQFSACQNKSFMMGLGALCLGAEAIVPHMYSLVVNGLRAVGEPEKNLEFFLIHIEGDDEHAVTMKKIIDKELARNPGARVDLEYGAKKSIEARAAFFQAIGAAHARKRGPEAKRKKAA